MLHIHPSCNMQKGPLIIKATNVLIVFNVPPTARVIWRRGHGFMSHNF